MGGEAIGKKEGRKCGGGRRRLNRILVYVGRWEKVEGKIAGEREWKGKEEKKMEKGAWNVGAGRGRKRKVGKGKGNKNGVIRLEKKEDEMK